MRKSQPCTKLIPDKFGGFYIKGDYTIYLKKQHPKDKLNIDDVHRNAGSFHRVIYHMDLHLVEPCLEFHYKNFPGKKREFLKFVKYDFESSMIRQGDKILPDLPQKKMLLSWVDDKLQNKTKHWILKSENLRWLITTMIAIAGLIIAIWKKG